MNTAEELPVDSDSSDEDYIPDKQPEEVVSEVESDGDPEESISDYEGTKKNGKRTKNNRKPKRKLKKVEEEPPAELNDKPKELTEEEKKKQADDIWANFMKDTGFKSKKNSCERAPTTSRTNPTSVQTSNNVDTVKKSSEKVKIMQVFEFAGEEVAVEKEVAVDSAEARLLSKSSSESTSSKSRSKGLSGISSVLSQLGKKPKISTLEKSKLDWDKFKREENLEEELQTHNKGKDGYLERQDFLQRADLRRFEIEKEIRTIERNKRLNNSM